MKRRPFVKMAYCSSKVLYMGGEEHEDYVAVEQTYVSRRRAFASP